MQIQTHIDHLDRYKTYRRMTDAIHSFLNANHYLELDLPVLSPALIPEGYLEVFETEFRYMQKREKLYLTPSPELFIKRLLSEGVGDCYYMGKSFRNSEPTSDKHFSEFTMLELYKVGEDYTYMKRVVSDMMRTITQELYGTDWLTFQGKKVNLADAEELTVAEAFERYASIKPSDLFDPDAFIARAREKGYATEGFSYEDVWSQLYTQEIESHLGTSGKPTFLFDYPLVFAALSKPNPDGKTAQRFEFYIEGIELGNCYSELVDHELQSKRLQGEQEERKRSGKIEHPLDYGFLDALHKGLPTSTGIAIGLERMGMVWSDAQSLSDIMLLTIQE